MTRYKGFGRCQRDLGGQDGGFHVDDGQRGGGFGRGRLWGYGGSLGRAQRQVAQGSGQVAILDMVVPVPFEPWIGDSFIRPIALRADLEEQAGARRSVVPRWGSRGGQGVAGSNPVVPTV